MSFTMAFNSFEHLIKMTLISVDGFAAGKATVDNFFSGKSNNSKQSV